MDILKKYVFLITLLSLLSIQVVSAAPIIVVANIEDTSIQLSRQEVRILFMGGALSYDLEPVALPADNQARVMFNTKLIGLTESRIQSYWAQMRFSGRKKPPIEIANEELVVEYILHHSGSVAYLPLTTEIPAGLTILFQID